jgi:triphosphoribosyl-dephospho-CoA synthase
MTVTVNVARPTSCVGPKSYGADHALAKAIAHEASSALLQELAAWPKPGLVSYVDNGSHRDMTAETLESSIAALHPFFEALALAGCEDAEMDTLRAIGMCAEDEMLKATGGVNTHRGAIFGLGLLCAAAGATATRSANGAPVTSTDLGRFVATRWGREILRGPVDLFSHGSVARRKYGVGGARVEAASGFHSVYDIGLPALRQGRNHTGRDHAAAVVHTCFALIVAVNDTNLLHRGGPEGAKYAAEAATEFMALGGVGAKNWRERAATTHAEFIERNLSPGGCADLLAMTLFVDALQIDSDAR